MSRRGSPEEYEDGPGPLFEGGPPSPPPPPEPPSGDSEGDDDTPLRRAFRVFHAENPHVYELFSRYALEACRAGRGRFGAWMVWNRMRWYARFETTEGQSGGFKLNNNLIAYYARHFMAEHPEYEGIFETRRAQGEE